MGDRPSLVCFDLGGVLVRICRSWEEGCAAAGVDLRPGYRPDATGEARRLEAVDALQRGAVTREQFWATVSETFRGVYSPAEVERVHRAWLLGEYTGVGDIIDRLHQRAVATACLSNTNEPHWEDLVAYDSLRRLQARYASHEMRLAKPDAAIYRAFEREVGASGEEILFFEDTPENAHAAADLGWRTCVVDPHTETAGQIEAALREHGLL
jgi:HAD superfamily hydrolase (TIGR01509 family)